VLELNVVLEPVENHVRELSDSMSQIHRVVAKSHVDALPALHGRDVHAASFVDAWCGRNHAHPHVIMDIKPIQFAGILGVRVGARVRQDSGGFATVATKPLHDDLSVQRACKAAQGGRD
jgi:hypothetical protein